MSQTLVSIASLFVIVFSTLIGYLQYREYKNEIQRTIYQTLVGNKYEFESEGEDETRHFTVVNVDVESGRLPGDWRTLLVIEFDLEEFPWDTRDDEVSDKVSKDLLWTFNLVSPETPDISHVELFDSYRSPALLVGFPTTNLFHVSEFLRKTEETIGTVLFHYERSGELDMRTYTKYMTEHLEFAIENSNFEDSASGED